MGNRGPMGVRTGRLRCIASLTGLLLVAALGCEGEGDGVRTATGVEESKGRTPAEKSIAFYAGRDLTADGGVLLGGFGHEPSSHWIEITPRNHFPQGTTLEVGVTGEARFPGQRIRVPQVGPTARFVTSNYSEFAGFPQPLTNGGLNEHGVAARTVWSPSRQELVALTPDPQTGLSYSDLARAAMERASSAEAAARLVGDLVEAYGYATYGGNSFLFADAREGWVVITFAGGQGLWAAERLGPDQVRVLYPGYLGPFPVDFQENPDFMGPPHLVRFAVEQGWFDPAEGDEMDLQAVYGRPFPSPPGEDDGRFRHPPDREVELEALAPVSLEDMFALVRDPRWSDDQAGYGQVAHLLPEEDRRLAALWVSVAPAVSAPFVPVFVEAGDVPPEYKQHRYMTKGAGSTFLDPGFAPLEATRGAYRVHRRLLYHTCSQPEAFLKGVTAELEAFEAAVAEDLASVRRGVARRLSAGDDRDALDVLTAATEGWLLDALDLAEELVVTVEREARSRYGIPMPDRTAPEGATWRPESEPMILPPETQRLHCYRPGLDDYPRAHGSYGDLVGSLRR